MRVLISGGGTGGHIFPALAVARALSELDPSGEVLYVGRKGGIEEEIVAAQPISMERLAMRGVQDEMWRNVPLVYVLPASILKARRIIGRFRPDAVLGTGGYVTAPVGSAAVLSRLPLFLQEQNAVPGRTTRTLARRARAVATAYDETATRLDGATVVRTGTPVRPEFTMPARPVGELRRLVVFGGSQGAHRINVAVAEGLKTLLEDPSLTVAHICGTADLQWLSGFRNALPDETASRYQLEPFVERMDLLLADADLVVARAGGSGIAEMTAMGRPMLLVPYPHAGDHQRHNAEPLLAAGAAIVVRDGELSGTLLIDAIKRLTGPAGAEKLRQMAAASAGFGRPDAAAAVSRLILETA